MNDQSHAPAGEDVRPLIVELIRVISENSGKLDTMQQLFSTTTLATENAVTHTRTLAENSSWERQGPQVAKALKEAVRDERKQASQLLDAAEIFHENATKLYDLGKEQTRTCAEGMVKTYEIAAKHHEAAMIREKGKWRRGAMIAAFGAVCAAAGFFAKEPATKTVLLMDIANALGENPHGVECSLIYGEKFTAQNSERRGCVRWEDPS